MASQRWETKLAAWVHDPAEKALVLMRDPAGHEGGTVAALQQRIWRGTGVPAGCVKILKRADHWASAADRPQFPMEEGGGRYQAWCQVNFAQNPILVHPLSGEVFDLKNLSDITPGEVRHVSLEHFSDFVEENDSGDVDFKQSFLNFWRFGPESPCEELGALWALLPADTRVPDHTIWSHLDLVSAFSGASLTDLGEKTDPALLKISFGPVQSFISQSRSTSDLWAGSHFMARLAWEGMKVICEELGPDAILFPQLRGNPLVDMWLISACGLDPDRFRGEDWAGGALQSEGARTLTDSNPIFSAALPNKFVALVPEDRGAELAEKIRARTRNWVQEEALAMWDSLLEIAGRESSDKDYAREQISLQLADFPEVHWSCIAWSAVMDKDEKPDPEKLGKLQKGMLPAGSAGLLDSSMWGVLSQQIEVDRSRFYRPNPGIFYPALYDIAERATGAAKQSRFFNQVEQEGYRCSLSGEWEWLTDEREQLGCPPGERTAAETLWSAVSYERPALAKKGEHLSAPAMLKRMWPTRFVSELTDSGIWPESTGFRRYVTSTHTIALSSSIGRWLDDPNRPAPTDGLLGHLKNQDSEYGICALPRKLARRLDSEFRGDEAIRLVVRRLPLLIEALGGLQDEFEEDQEIRGPIEPDQLTGTIRDLLGVRKFEAYYGLILFDGDQMGAWLSGAEGASLRFRDTWHPGLATKLEQRFGDRGLQAYLDAPRPVSPARHMAISEALNGFSLRLARFVIEDLCKGKLIYSGGDDVLALVSVDEILTAMLLVRAVFSGSLPEGMDAGNLQPLTQCEELDSIRLGRGFVQTRGRNGRLFRMMGSKATGSCGAVVAHHSAPLGRVLGELRTAEQRAKQQGGRDAFSISTLKRSGGALYTTCKWFSQDTGVGGHPIGLLLELRNALASKGFSRRVVYLAQSWIQSLPGPGSMSAEAYTEMLCMNLSHQFRRQGGGKFEDLAVRVATFAAAQDDPVASLHDFLGVAEFLAREGRTASVTGEPE